MQTGPDVKTPTGTWDDISATISYIISKLQHKGRQLPSEVSASKILGIPGSSWTNPYQRNSIPWLVQSRFQRRTSESPNTIPPHARMGGGYVPSTFYDTRNAARVIAGLNHGAFDFTPVGNNQYHLTYEADPTMSSHLTVPQQMMHHLLNYENHQLARLRHRAQRWEHRHPNQPIPDRLRAWRR